MPALAPVNVTLFGKVSGPRDDGAGWRWILGADPESNGTVIIRERLKENSAQTEEGNAGRRVHMRTEAETRGCGHKPMNTWSHGSWKRQGGSLPWTLPGWSTPQSLDCWAPEP